MIALIMTLAIFGLIAYLILTYIPMPEPVKTLILVVVVLLVIMYLLQVVGFDLPVPRIRSLR